MQNIEIKARYSDLAKARAIAQKLGAQFLWKDRQIDTYFKTPNGRLKLRESDLKMAELIPYQRPIVAGPKKSDYLVIPIEDPGKLKSMLSSLLGIDVVVEKIRELYMIGNVRVHLDEVHSLGRFFEFEAVYERVEDELKEKEKVQTLLSAFEIHERDLLTGSYRELLRENAKV